jgi:hypothetical protein
LIAGKDRINIGDHGLDMHPIKHVLRSDRIFRTRACDLHRQIQALHVFLPITQHCGQLCAIFFCNDRFERFVMQGYDFWIDKPQSLLRLKQHGIGTQDRKSFALDR